ncbi:alpha/beta fold hydrolase [Sneathiella limimaris]|uniref:alpha/beta fold hydrolase n=1 Tax=Sneathiella limimaris TaxID=1964213 RepID=UPI00146A2879|nr:alpha/beta hydrolase [Sneathiella limimaris]
MTGTSNIWTAKGGADTGPLLVLIHGLGANATVWDNLINEVSANWSGGWMSVDMRGHGRSGHPGRYSVGDYAADIAALIPADREIALLGHSLGGVVALALASGLYGLTIRSCTAVGIKTNWPEEDFARAAHLAAQAPKLFDTEEAAIDRYLKVAGLFGLVEPTSESAKVGITLQGSAYRLASDPKTNGVTPLDFAGLAALARCPVHFLCGDKDPVATPAGMESLGYPVTLLPGGGHYPFVVDPAGFWTAIQDRL